MNISILGITLVLGIAFCNAGGKVKIPMLRGVNYAGTEYACVEGKGIFDSPSDDATIENMLKWNINAVRVPLNENCWFGWNILHAEHGGQYYQSAIEDWVRRLRKHHLYVILELHWTEGMYNGEGSCRKKSATCQKPMPDMELSPRFWTAIANMFKDDEGVIFDLFNEPFPERVITDINQAWKCWQKGGSECPGFEYEVAGMEQLVKAVRDTGANNLIMLGGLNYANNLEGWLDYLPNDENIAASMHSYNFNSCVDKECWDKGIGKIIAIHPVIVGEIGDNDCTHNHIDKIMPYLEERKISYLAWTWNSWGCNKGPSLVNNYDGEPTNFGLGYKNHLEKFQLNLVYS